MVENSNSSEKPLILWVDDDPLVLSSARRLLGLHGFGVLTTENPNEVLSLLEKNEVLVLVADQRMPQMTGIEVLKLAKEKYPLVARVMITGFYNRSLLEEAVNTAGVFRFITKPWSEKELINDIRQAMDHARQIQKNQILTNEIRKQNQMLQQLTDNLENIVFDRTKEVNKSNKDQEDKNKRIRGLVHFIQNLQRVEDLTELLDFFLKDLKTTFKVESLILCFLDNNSEYQMLFSQKKDWHQKLLKKAWSSKNEIRTNDKEDQRYLVDNLLRPIHKTFSFPLLKFHGQESLPNSLFIEHDLEESKVDRFMDYMTSRLQILSLAVDRIIYLQKIEYNSKQWEYTFDSVRNPICIVNMEGEKLKFNTSFKKEIKNIAQIEKELIAKVLREESRQIEFFKKDDKIFELNCLPIKEETQEMVTHFVMYYRDITEERSLYVKMIQNEKMAALGLLSGNIAHELNNPLTGIRSLAQILLKENLPQSYISDLNEIDKASERCQNVIMGLREFSEVKSNSNQLEIVFLGELIQKTLPLLKSALRRHQLHLHLASEDIGVMADPRLLQQIIFNLIINACQALQDNGRIEIRTEKRGISGILEIEDNGSGIPVEIRERIFDPFFTTKKEGEGTGLGLSFCKSMIEKMGGQITFQSQEKKGTTFKLKIPLATKKRRQSNENSHC